ncbi:MAG: hypothetical protein BWX71_02084 [Deltaproteobacteria bacterium ADurb.Bin072]|nr:MAG: hypothetical protein BWX71_02084 [Deltaproteobacteria bacterium ADurb.Bin072]
MVCRPCRSSTGRCNRSGRRHRNPPPGSLPFLIHRRSRRSSDHPTRGRWSNGPPVPPSPIDHSCIQSPRPAFHRGRSRSPSAPISRRNTNSTRPHQLHCRRRNPCAIGTACRLSCSHNNRPRLSCRRHGNPTPHIRASRMHCNTSPGNAYHAGYPISSRAADPGRRSGCRRFRPGSRHCPDPFLRATIPTAPPLRSSGQASRPGTRPSGTTTTRSTEQIRSSSA